MVRKKRLPIGIEDFYYVDKTGLITELLQNWGKVNLFTRPRRFGKSLNMSMLKRFFEYGCDRRLFEGLVIAEERELCDRYMGSFPVVSITLKGAEARDYEGARAMLASIVGKAALRHSFLLESDKLSNGEKELFSRLITVGKGEEPGFVMPEDVIKDSLLKENHQYPGYQCEESEKGEFLSRHFIRSAQPPGGLGCGFQYRSWGRVQ